MRRAWLAVACVTIGAWASGMLVDSAEASSSAPTVSITGTVGSPATYSIAALQALPQTTEAISGHTYGGVLLDTLVKAAAPVYPSPTPKNAILRVIVTAAPGAGGAGGPVTFAMGEFQPSDGNNPALLAVTQDGSVLSAGPELVLPNDISTARFVSPVAELNVAFKSPTSSEPALGSINVVNGTKTTLLTAAQLAALPQVSIPVTFRGGGPSPTGVQNLTETGPTLYSVLGAVGIRPDANTFVQAVGSDSYSVDVTPAEATFGDRPLLIANTETVTDTGMPTTGATPRLVIAGDVAGPRYVSIVTDLVVGEGSVVAPVNLSPPSITGTATQGRILTESPASWSNGVLSSTYQWLRCPSGAGCRAISGATGSTYTLTAPDAGASIAVQETATNSGGASLPATSAQTAVVQASVPTSGKASAGSPTENGATAQIRLRCAGGASSRCTVTTRLTLVEKLRGGRVVGVGAAGRTTLEPIIVGSRTVTLHGGESERVRIALDGVGRRLLASRHKLAATLSVTQNRSTIFTRAITFKAR